MRRKSTLKLGRITVSADSYMTAKCLNMLLMLRRIAVCLADEAGFFNGTAKDPQRASSPARLLYDYGAAFPSLAREFLWLCLCAVGVPAFIIEAIGHLYRNNRHY